MFEQTRIAVLCAYRELRARGLSDCSAFASAVRLFRHRYPDIPGEDASFVVADWIGDALER
ncbi:MAG: hypothetical protein ACFCUO_13105 [Rhodospirillales bacterium]